MFYVLVYCVSLYLCVDKTKLEEFFMETSFIMIIAAIISMKFRGFSDEVALPLVAMFIILTIIAFYASS